MTNHEYESHTNYEELYAYVLDACENFRPLVEEIRRVPMNSTVPQTEFHAAVRGPKHYRIRSAG
jgi:hypothetical protein